MSDWYKKKRMQQFAELNEENSTHPAPELPEGYRADWDRLTFGAEKIAMVRDKELHINQPVKEKHFPALITFLQGAR